MAIKKSETSLTTNEYNKLLNGTTGFNLDLIIYRQNPSFDTIIANTAAPIGAPFHADTNDTIIMRAYTLGEENNVYIETFNGSAWSTAIAITSNDAASIVNPRVVWTGSEWNVYLLKSNGYIYKYVTTNNGVSWNSGTQWSTIHLANVQAIAFADGGLPVLYAYTTNNSKSIIAINQTTQFDTGIYWANDIHDFDAIDFLADPDDTTGSFSHTDVRHCLTIAAAGPTLYTYTSDDSGTPIPTPVPTGGILSWTVRPPNAGRTIQVSPTYPVDIYDQGLTFQNRMSSRLSSTSSVHGPTNRRDTLWLVSYGQDGDQINVNDAAYYYNAVFYYSSRDGKHWSQNKIIPLLDDNVDFISSPTMILRCGNYVYLLSARDGYKSKGCYEFYNPHPDLTLDVTHRISSWSSSISDARQSTVELFNNDNKLWSTFIGQPGTLTLITKLGIAHGPKVQISVEEIDSIQPHHELASEIVSITARDRTSWISDRIQSTSAEYWDSQVSGLDQFRDINAANDTGLAFSDVVKGSFTTSIVPFSLSLQDNYQEGISFNVFKSNILDGRAMTIFKIPVPTSHGGTSAANSTTYAGLVFRAQDKDNLWHVQYDYWAERIILYERRRGIDVQIVSHAPTSAFLALASTGQKAGLMVDFRGGRFDFYESTVINGPFSAQYEYSFTHYIDASTSDEPALLQGYVGIIGCGFSDQVDTDTSTPGDIIPTTPPLDTGGGDYGPIDDFKPTRYYLLTARGRVLRGSGSVGAPSWTDISPGTVLRNVLASANSSVDFCIDMVFDPFHLNTAILLGPHSIIKGENMNTDTPTYTDLDVHTPTDYVWGFQLPAGYHAGGMVASINCEGYFGWLEIPYNGADGIQYAYTTDNFASVHHTNIGQYPYVGGGGGVGLTIGQHASSPSNIPVWIYCNRNAVQKSSNGGSSFSSDTSLPAFPYDVESGGAINLPYTLSHGTDNASNDGLVIYYGNNGAGGWAVNIQNQLVRVPLGGSGSSTCGVNSLTVDGDYLAMMVGQQIIRTSDGGQFWYAVPLNNRPGYGWYTGLCGWPTNPDFYITFGIHCSVTFDGGVTWTEITPPGVLDSGDFVVKGQADLTEAYDAGGPVH